METFLLVITGVSLVAALFLGWTAWRLARAERERAMARVAALAAAVADVTAPVAEPQPRSTEPARAQWSTPARPRSSGRMAAVRPTVEEIEWAPPRPEELHPAAHGPRGGDAGLMLRPEPARPQAMSDTFLGAPARAGQGVQGVLAMAAVLLLFVLGAAGAWVYSTPATSSTGTPIAQQAPLELLSLRHQRAGNQLSVTGMIRNPPAAPVVNHLSATVLLFDQQGGYLTSARAPIDVPRLDPGQESPFTLSVQAPAGATRYRVTFRTDDRIVNHIDRRGDTPATPATTTGTTPAHAVAR